jgi:chorismate dehydratase
MDKIKVSAVSYLNSTPFVYGLEHSELIHEIELSLDIPAVCAQKTLTGAADIGLIPVAVIPQMKESYIITDYCIGAVGRVNSVMLYSHVPLEQIKKITLDNQSRTSVNLVRVLADNFWKISPQWEQAGQDYEKNIKGASAAVVIGDRTFEMNGEFPFVYDLAEEWQKFTGLPFVFACWVANKKLPGTFLEKFNSAIRAGLEKRPLIIAELKELKKYKIDIEEYLGKNISYQLDDEKRRALDLFLSYLPAEGF